MGPPDCQVTPFRLCVAVAVFGMLAVATGRAQGTPVTACRELPCSLIVDWGVGKSVADMPPDRSCATIGEAIVSFATTDQGAKLPTAVRIINRCGASEGVMSMKQFGKFVGEMIWFALDGEHQKANKPSGKC